MIYVGTSGWAYKAWQPDFFPPKLAQARFLQHYAGRLNAVEVNYSFRRMVPESTFIKWDKETPAGFQFSIKAHQAITHWRRLKNAEESLARFVDSLQPLASARKLGPVLFQLPPDFKADCEVLGAFLSLLPRNFRAAFEFRHPTWFDDRVYDLLRDHNVSLCLAESEDLTTPPVSTATYSYYRFRKPDYSASDRQEIASQLRDHERGGRELFAYFKHEERPESALYAEEVLQLATGSSANRKSHVA